MAEEAALVREGAPTTSEDGEEALVARFVATGDRRAFEQLVRAHLPAIRRFLAMRLADPEEAAEAEQEVLVRLFRSLPSFRGDSGFRTWLFRICCLATADLVRRKARERSRRRLLAWSLPDHDPRPEDEPSFGYERAESARELRLALAALGEPDASLLYLRDAEGLPVAELALAFRMKEGTVKSRLARARARLRAILEETGRDAPGRSE